MNIFLTFMKILILNEISNMSNIVIEIIVMVISGDTCIKYIPFYDIWYKCTTLKIEFSYFWKSSGWNVLKLLCSLDSTLYSICLRIKYFSLAEGDNLNQDFSVLALLTFWAKLYFVGSIGLRIVGWLAHLWPLPTI